MPQIEVMFYFCTNIILYCEMEGVHAYVREKEFVRMDTSAPFTFRILKILKSHTSMSQKIIV
jgi:hypothetical protein